jgi:hypothetical protein
MSRNGVLDETLDFLSEKFDPLKGFRLIREIPPELPKVRPFDTLEQCRFLLPLDDPNYQPSKKQLQAKNTKVLSDAEKITKGIIN